MSSAGAKKIADKVPKNASARGISAAEAEAVAKREEKRRIKAEICANDAEKLKKQGNTAFRSGDFVNAAHFFALALDLCPTRSIYASNSAAAWLKLEDYPRAESVATMALCIDTNNIKARYRRGVARKNMCQYKGAMLDFEAVKEVLPTGNDAEIQYTEASKLYLSGASVDHSVSIEDAMYPRLASKGMFADDEDIHSNSSDCEHEGNGLPCRDYNHDGCRKGAACAYSHAPEEHSMRDKLGKNVCLYYLLGECKFEDAECKRSHDKRFIPNQAFWNDPTSVAEAREGLLESVQVQKLAAEQAKATEMQTATFAVMNDFNETGTVTSKNMNRLRRLVDSPPPDGVSSSHG
ncbi:hypothetical protein PLICRDRAFT_695334 [Plicaturopsis crispa FD-325 SS-3]|nr:hypothetical protein PLICRDRAFT_695334 [Plicaturopsis crispa FD-325 SS-3]